MKRSLLITVFAVVGLAHARPISNSDITNRDPVYILDRAKIEAMLDLFEAATDYLPGASSRIAVSSEFHLVSKYCDLEGGVQPRFFHEFVALRPSQQIEILEILASLGVRRPFALQLLGECPQQIGELLGDACMTCNDRALSIVTTILSYRPAKQPATEMSILDYLLTKYPTQEAVPDLLCGFVRTRWNLTLAFHRAPTSSAFICKLLRSASYQSHPQLRSVLRFSARLAANITDGSFDLLYRLTWSLLSHQADLDMESVDMIAADLMIFVQELRMTQPQVWNRKVPILAALLTERLYFEPGTECVLLQSSAFCQMLEAVVNGWNVQDRCVILSQYLSHSSNKFLPQVFMYGLKDGEMKAFVEILFGSDDLPRCFTEQFLLHFCDFISQSTALESIIDYISARQRSHCLFGSTFSQILLNISGKYPKRAVAAFGAENASNRFGTSDSDCLAKRLGPSLMRTSEAKPAFESVRCRSDSCSACASAFA